ncbi:MAG: hypothetical protein H6715_06765 [Myxococcales bacterium]|nr:hypothetical protein [Myxococcales bacterium]
MEFIETLLRDQPGRYAIAPNCGMFDYITAHVIDETSVARATSVLDKG